MVSQDKHQIVFRATADEHPDAETGDVLLVLQEQEQSVFNRNELFLVEALCGLELEITSHLDGRKLQVTTPPGEIVQPMMQGLDPVENAMTLSAADQRARVYDIRVMARRTTSRHRGNVKSNLRGSRSGHERC